MKVARWGNSLAVRLPRTLVDELALKDGDEVELVAGAGGRIEVVRDETREAALEALRATRWSLPDGYRFDRAEIYEARTDRAPAEAMRAAKVVNE